MKNISKRADELKHENHMMDVERISMRIAFGNSNLIDSRLLRIAFRVIEASKVDDLILANPGLEESIKKLSDNDPSKSNKYIEWSVKQLKQLKQLKLEATMGDLISTIQAFHKVQNRLEKKDINQYKTLKELEDAIKDLPESKTKEKIQVKSGAKKLWENDTHVLFRMHTQNACIAYGKGTKWCITMKDDNPWDEYTNNNSIFYFLIDKRPSESEYSKIAWNVRRNMDDNSVEEVEIHDALDDLITNSTIQGIPEFSNINRMIIEDAPKAPDGPNVSKRKELLKKNSRGSRRRGESRPARGGPARGEPNQGGPARGGHGRGKPERGKPERGVPDQCGFERGGPGRGEHDHRET